MASNTSNLTTGFSSQYFPIRSLINKQSHADEGGAWLVAYKAEQRRRFKAILSNEPNKQVTVEPSKLRTAKAEHTEQEQPVVLDGFFLMKNFHIEDPTDLCSIKINGKRIKMVKENDFVHFTNVVHVDAGDNNLPFDAFRKFPSLEELELPLNSVRGTTEVSPVDFPKLQVLDLSYNRLSSDDILNLGILPNLKTLHLTGNELKALPAEMARSYRTITGVTGSGKVKSEEQKTRFPELQNLYLDQNELTDISTFASLAGLKRLKYLNLESNEISSVPHLRLLGARMRQDAPSNVATEDVSGKDAVNESIEEIKLQDSLEVDINSLHEADKQKDSENIDDFDLMLKDKILEEESPLDEPVAPELSKHFSDLTEDPSLLGERYDPPQPFQQLLHLNLANNLILEEEGLLVLATWPALKELVIWGNPLTTVYKGDPPVLAYRLGRINGVRIFRKKPPAKPKPQVDLLDNKRKVDDTMPPKPRKRNLMMLEGPQQEEISYYVGPHPQPLPPIGTAASAQLKHREDRGMPRHVSTAPGRTQGLHSTLSSRVRSSPPIIEDSKSKPSEHQLQSRGHVTSEETVGTAEREMQAETKRAMSTEDTFFMTQVDEEDTERKERESPRLQNANIIDQSDRPLSVEDKYKGFEELLDVDETESDMIFPKDIQGSVRALHYALSHPLIFTKTGSTYTDRRQKPKLKSDTSSSVPKSRQSKVEELGNILDKMKIGPKMVEANLENVLKEYKTNPRVRKEFPEVKKLLDEVQTKYNQVRVASLKPASAGAKLFGNGCDVIPENSKESLSSDEKDSLHELKKLKERIESRL